MSWRTGECECGNTVNYGIYYSEHEDDLSEINVTVICGVCVRERDGIPSENEVDEHFENFNNDKKIKPFGALTKQLPYGCRL